MLGYNQSRRGSFHAVRLLLQSHLMVSVSGIVRTRLFLKLAWYSMLIAWVILSREDPQIHATVN